MRARRKHTTATAIFKPRLLDQNLSHSTSNKTPMAINNRAPKTWAIIGASLGAHQARVIHNKPKPTATRELHPRVFLKLS